MRFNLAHVAGDLLAYRVADVAVQRDLLLNLERWKLFGFKTISRSDKFQLLTCRGSSLPTQIIQIWGL